LLSNCTSADAALSASPLFEDGVVTQACTAAVTSTVTNSPAADTCIMPAVVPIAGSVLYVTLYSPHAPLTGETDTAPGVLARLQ
jgi:hypothetical protein